MPMQILSATRDAQGYHFAVHLDTTQLVKDDRGKKRPDPEWVREWHWPLDHDDRIDDETYVKSLLAETRLLALAACKPSTPPAVIESFVGHSWETDDKLPESISELAAMAPSVKMAPV